MSDPTGLQALPEQATLRVSLAGLVRAFVGFAVWAAQSIGNALLYAVLGLIEFCVGIGIMNCVHAGQGLWHAFAAAAAMVNSVKNLGGGSPGGNPPGGNPPGTGGGGGGGGGQVEFVGDSSFFQDRVTSYLRGVIEATLHDPDTTIHIPASAVAEVGKPGVGPSTSEAARLAGYQGGATIIQVPDPSLAGIDPAALVPSGNFDRTDMEVVQEAKNRGIPVITTNKRMVTQIGPSNPPRYNAWGKYVTILLVPQS